MVLVAGLFFFGIKAVRTIKIDIFPATVVAMHQVRHKVNKIGLDHLAHRSAVFDNTVVS